jgi:CubicO group peptidase (beta-lactamase class C family)
VALLARDGKLGYLRAKGFQDVEAGKQMTTDTLFRIASMSKPVTSVAVMILVDDGRLTVTDPVSKYLPEFKNPKVLMPGSGGDSKLVPAGREITIRDLLTHTSGLTYRFMAQEPFAELYHKADICDGLTRPSFTLAENVRRLASLPLLHQPGSAYQYSLSTDVLGRLVEVISGQDLESFMRSRIFEPLGMNDTYFDLPTDKTGRLAVVYEPGPDKRIRRVGEEPVHKGELVYCVTCPYRGQRGYCSGGAGLTSSAADYARFLQMLLNGGQWNGTRILKPATVREMTSNQIGDLEFMSPTMRFGYGFGIWAGAGKYQVAAAGSYGWCGFYSTGFWVDPEKKLVGVFMTQLSPSDHPLFGDFEKLAHAAPSRSIEGLPTASVSGFDPLRENKSRVLKSRSCNTESPGKAVRPFLTRCYGRSQRFVDGTIPAAFKVTESSLQWHDYRELRASSVIRTGS